MNCPVTPFPSVLLGHRLLSKGSCLKRYREVKRQPESDAEGNVAKKQKL